MADGGSQTLRLEISQVKDAIAHALGDLPDKTDIHPIIENVPIVVQTVRLKISGVLGCYSLDALKRVSALAITQNGKATADQLNAEECRIFDTQHGEVIDAKEGAICIQGLGNTRCLWFNSTASALAKRY